ncbi:MAG: 50S ribosomal protein L13 [Acidimicrobiia bacterium]
MRTFSPTPDDISSDWYVLDAQGARLGRVATEAATLLRGKHKPTWAPNVAGGDHVVVINASGLDVSARKAEQKTYHRHSGYPGGLRTETLEHLIERDPAQVVKKAVKGMLPKNRLGRSMLRNLRVYAGPAHPHAAQRPQSRAISGSAR